MQLRKLPPAVRVLLLGSGGRECAFAWKISQSRRVEKLFIAPGNAGTGQYGTNVDLQPSNFGSLKQFILQNSINMVMVGPEEPLVKGIYNFISEDPQIHHVAVVGPSSAGARLEGSKEFAKDFMKRHDIPTAAYRSFRKDNVEEAFRFIDTLQPPYVLKADGLAAGKGVVIVSDAAEAKAELSEIFSGKFGAAGNTIVIEEFLKGIECSVFVVTDGKNFRILPVAKDYKRIGEGDTGLNTGGMGAVSPVPFADEEFMELVRDTIAAPTVKGLAEEKIVYRGFIFLGLMNVGGKPYVIEYNARMGDPETEAVLPLLESDIVDLFEGIVCGTLDHTEIAISPRHAATVICVAGGYPGSYEKGKAISGLQEAAAMPDTVVFHAGTAAAGPEVRTNGGRVLAVTSLGDTPQEALKRSYAAVEKISFEGMTFRRDIGKDLI